MNRDSGNDSGAGRRIRVCRFWTRSLGNCPSTSMLRDNFGVELIVGRHSLFDLVTAVRRIGGPYLFREMPDDVAEDYMYGHLVLDGREYNPLTPSNPVPLSSLGLRRGQRGEYVNDGTYHGGFTFEVDDSSFVCHDAPAAFPRKVVAPERRINASCDSSHLTQEEKERAQQLRYDYEDYYEFLYRHGHLNGYCRGTHDVKYQAPPWGHEDDLLITWFIDAGWKPKKTWESCLKYSFVDRTESAFSQRWQKCRKGQGRAWGTQCESVVFAKRCSINVMQRHFYEGGPSFLDPDDQTAFEHFKNSRYY